MINKAPINPSLWMKRSCDLLYKKTSVWAFYWTLKRRLMMIFNYRATWVAQRVEHPVGWTSAQTVISGLRDQALCQAQCSAGNLLEISLFFSAPPPAHNSPSLQKKKEKEKDSYIYIYIYVWDIWGGVTNKATNGIKIAKYC